MDIEQTPNKTDLSGIENTNDNPHSAHVRTRKAQKPALTEAKPKKRVSAKVASSRPASGNERVSPFVHDNHDAKLDSAVQKWGFSVVSTDPYKSDHCTEDESRGVVTKLSVHDRHYFQPYWFVGQIDAPTSE